MEREVEASEVMVITITYSRSHLGTLSDFSQALAHSLRDEPGTKPAGTGCGSIAGPHSAKVGVPWVRYMGPVGPLNWPSPRRNTETTHREYTGGRVHSVRILSGSRACTPNQANSAQKETPGLRGFSMSRDGLEPSTIGLKVATRARGHAH
jgi:hypothetical protein